MNISLLPRFLQVELTYACNSKCSFCYNPHRNYYAPKNINTNILSSINEYKIRHVQLIGGEVTLLDKLPYYLDILDKVGWKSIVTNGRIYRHDIKNKVDEIYLSLHGELQTHEYLTNATGTFEKVINTIEKYVDWGIDVNSDTVLTKYNAGEIYNIAKKAKSLGMKRVFLNIFQPEGIGSSRPDFSPSLSQIQQAITQMIEARDGLGIDMHFGTSTPLCLDKRLITERLGFRCGAGEWFGSINPDGEFRICNHSTKSFGNVLSEELNRIWHNKHIDDEYRNVKTCNIVCENCPLIALCLGGCRINEDGQYRIDPIVDRYKESILTEIERTELKYIYEMSNFTVSILDKKPT